MAITVQVEAVGYFRMVDTVAFNNRHSLTFCSSGNYALERKDILPEGK
jgi:hypothetical protein